MAKPTFLTLSGWRRLCSELLDIVTAHANPDEDAVGYVSAVVTCARAALAQPEAVEPGPDYPASGVDVPTDEELAAAYEEGLEGGTYKPKPVGMSGRQWLHLEGLRSVLAHLGEGRGTIPVGGSEKELIEWLRANANTARPNPAISETTIIYCEEREVFYKLAEAALLLETLHAKKDTDPFNPVPIPTAKRLPEVSDCDEHGSCWFGNKLSFSDKWEWFFGDAIIYNKAGCTHWLPASVSSLPALYEVEK